MYAKRYAAYAEMAACQKTREFQEAYAKKHSGSASVPSMVMIIKDDNLIHENQEPHVDVAL